MNSDAIIKYRIDQNVRPTFAVKCFFMALFMLPSLFTLVAQQRTNKTWSDAMLKSDFAIRYDREKRKYLFVAEKYQRKGEFGTLAEGSVQRIQQVVVQMDSAFQSKDPDKLFALGRYKYTFNKVIVDELIEVETLIIEDLIKDDSGALPVYRMSAGTLSGIKAFVKELE